MDKVQKIREEVERIQLYTQSEVLKQVLDYIDEVQKEPVSEDLEQAIDTYLATYWGHEKEKQNWVFLKKMAIYFANWQKQKDSIPVSEELEEASKEWLAPQLDNSYANYGEGKMMELTHFDGYAMLDAIEFGAKWQKEHLLKPADGKDLPEYEREVIVLTQSYPLKGSEYAVYFAHRPDPKGWDGKSIATGEVKHYTPKTYGKGGWNIPNVKWWLDCSLPNMEED